MNLCDNTIRRSKDKGSNVYEQRSDTHMLRILCHYKQIRKTYFSRNCIATSILGNFTIRTGRQRLNIYVF